MRLVGRLLRLGSERGERRLRRHGLARHRSLRRHLGYRLRGLRRDVLWPRLTRKEQADIAALDAAHHLIAHDSEVGGEYPIVPLVRELHLRSGDRRKDSNATEALLPDLPGHRLGRSGPVDDHATIASITPLRQVQGKVFLAYGVEEPRADP